MDSPRLVNVGGCMNCHPAILSLTSGFVRAAVLIEG